VKTTIVASNASAIAQRHALLNAIVFANDDDDVAALGAELALRVVSTAESRRLNVKFRGRDAPTNVLSFPAAKWRASPSLRARPLGDLVICARLLRTEARSQGKTLRAHWAHLVVHGALHLIGYDHERARDAARMERREIQVLKGLGFANPYRSA